MARTVKNPKQMGHRRLLLQREKAQSRRRSGDGLVWFTRTPGSFSIPKTRQEDVEGGHEACRTRRTPGQIAKFHSFTFVTHVGHGGPGCSK